MPLHTLTLENFRNHSQSTVEFGEKNTIFIGQNGAGKTNLLEALYSFAILRPFRASKREVFVRDKEPFARVILKKDDDLLEIFWETAPARTVFKKNGVIMRTAEFLNQKNFFAVLFAPDDLNLPFVAPGERRKIFARTLGGLFPDYFTAHLRFEKVLKRRNRLLQDQALAHEFAFWDEEFATLSTLLTARRAEFIDFLNTRLADYFSQIAGRKSDLRADFVPSSDDITVDLSKNFVRDLAIGSTSRGAHRDDFVFYLRGEPLAEQASRGEVRSAILAFRLAERDFIREKTGSAPVLLFDDVFSELDHQRAEAFLALVRDEQAVITTTDLDGLDFDLMKARVYAVAEGGIKSSGLD